MSLRQFNATYVPEEDRVLFRLTTNANEEYRLWFTRSRVAEFLGLGEKAAVLKLAKDNDELLPQQAKAVAEFQQQAAKESAQFTQFEPAARLPLGAEPLLVKALVMNLQDQVLVLQLEMSASRVLTLRLNDDMFSKLRILFDNISQKARWQLHAGANVLDQPQEASLAEPDTAKSGKLLH
jgi:hypothetical protein